MWKVVDKVTRCAYANGATFTKQDDAEKECNRLKELYGNQDLEVWSLERYLEVRS